MVDFTLEFNFFKMEDLKKRWNIDSNFQLFMIIIVFAINGTITARISYYLLDLLQISKYNTNLFIYYFLFIFLVLPIYPFLLMAVGYIFGQSNFFLPFSKKLLNQLSFGLFFK